MSQIVVGTAGHIDHGKTSLVKAITGTNTDSLNEEKIRGMTIDLGFAYLNKTITIIDVPGHEKFIRNMTAGAAGIHYGLVVVAADDGVMPQTKEHLDILTLLGVKIGWVAITKIDIVDDSDWIDLVEIDIQDCLKERGFKSLSIRRINNINSYGIDLLKKDIISINHKITKSTSNKFRMNVDRVFSKTGFGTVVTGTVVNGFAKIGQELEISPSGLKSKIRGLQSHGGIAKIVKQGDRAAINFANLKSFKLNRGDVVSSKGTVHNSKIIIANIIMIKSTDWRIRNKQRLRFHFGTAEILGRVVLDSSKILQKGEQINLIIKLESSVSVAMDDYFIIRSYSPMETIAGGVILSPNPIYSWKKLYKICSQIPIDPSHRFKFLVNYHWRRPKSFKEWNDLFFNSKINIESLTKLYGILESENGILYSKDNKEKAKKEILNYINECYINNPYRKVLTPDSIKSKLSWSEAWFKEIIIDLINNKLIINAPGGYTLYNYEIDISKKDLIAIDKLEKILKNAKMEPIFINELIKITGHRPKHLSDLLHILITNKKIEFLGNEIYMHKNNLNHLINELKLYFSNNETIGISDFKSLFILTRKTAIPLLEYLDKYEYTKRNGNFRIQGKALE